MKKLINYGMFFILTVFSVVFYFGCSSDEEPSVVEDISEPPTEIQKAIYWTSLHTINRANLDGSNVEVLVAGLDYAVGIALDVSEGKMYWTDSGADKIQRANLDGTNIEDLVTDVGSVGWNIALDVSGGKMYWISGTDRRDEVIIERANMDGSNIEDLVTGLEFVGDPTGIALDISGGKMYWTDTMRLQEIRGSVRGIQRANLDGSNAEWVLLGIRPDVTCIALDVSGGKMYWARWNNKYPISRANLDGSDIEDLVTHVRKDIIGITLDVLGGKIYWTSISPYKIQRANLDGSNIENIVLPDGHHAVGGIALNF